MSKDDPNLIDWMREIERRLSRLEAYMKVFGSAVTVSLPTIIYILFQLLSRIGG